LIDLVSKQDRRLIRSAPIYEREGIAYTTIEPFIISKYREKIGHMVPDEEVVLIKKPEPHAGIFVNWVDEDAFEDYISDQDRDYNALHLRIETAPSSWGDRVYAAEFQAKTTLEDALQEDAQQQSHEAYRNWQLAMVEFLIDKGYMGITRRRTNGDLAPEDLAVAQEEGRARAYLIRRLLSPNQVYHHYAYGT